MPVKHPSRVDLELLRTLRVLSRFELGAELATLAAAVQRSLDYLPPHLIPEVAEKAGLRAEVAAARLEADPRIRLAPPGRHRVTVCTGMACASAGSTRLVRKARETLDIGVFRSTRDAAMRLDVMKCMGKCAMAPNVSLDGQVRGAMTEERFGLLVEMLSRRG